VGSSSTFHHILEKVVGSSTVLGWMRNNRIRVHYNLDEVGMKTSKSGCLDSTWLIYPLYRQE
jgi:hypothetical protein